MGRSLPTRRAVLTGALATGLAGALFPGSAHAGGHPPRTSDPQSRLRVDPRSISFVATREPVVALTFDDGPDPASTPCVLDVLEHFGVPATFFMIGRNVVEHRELATEVVRRGHEVANHSQDHLWLDQQPRGVVQRQVDLGAQSLVRAGAPPNGLFRPPHGWTSGAVAGVLRREGSRSIFWSDCLEHHLALGTPATAVAAMAARARPGSILLCHDGGHLDGPHPQKIDRSATVAALPHLLEAVLAKHLRFVTVSELTGV
jgi:peptidoglycan/xylan/chitin deacetylase (PgdA/CDA1 family)